MKKNEIKIGGFYTAKVSGKLTTVRVLQVRTISSMATRSFPGHRPDRTVYDVVNQTTGRRTTFHSAAKFRYIENTGHQILKGVAELTQAQQNRVKAIEDKYSTEKGATEEERQEAQSILESAEEPRHAML